MDSRIQSKFVLSDRRLLEVESQTELESLLLATVPNQAGRILDVTITFKTTTDKPWVRCEQLGYYRDDLCGHLNPPAVPCKENHFHRPDWVVDSITDEGHCTECQRLNITPSRDSAADKAYNHRNAPSSSGY